jgi:hypothetical protein
MEIKPTISTNREPNEPKKWDEGYWDEGYWDTILGRFIGIAVTTANRIKAMVSREKPKISK